MVQLTLACLGVKIDDLYILDAGYICQLEGASGTPINNKIWIFGITVIAAISFNSSSWRVYGRGTSDSFMAGRNCMPRHLIQDGPQAFHDGPPLPMPRGPGPMPLHPVEEELAVRELDIRRLFAENQFLVDENMGRNRELVILKEELHNLNQAIPKVRAEKEALAREHIQKCLKLEADLRALVPLKAEVVQLKSEAQKLDAQCQELSAKSQTMSRDLKHLQTENQQIPAMKVDIDALRQELIAARTAHEYENKAHAELIRQKQVMENNLISMAREIEKLKVEIRSMEKRPGGAGVGAYGVQKAIPDMGYFGSFGDDYGSGKKGLYGSGASYELRGVPRH